MIILWFWGCIAWSPTDATDACTPIEETCDQRDQDCDGQIDEGLPTRVYVQDADQDGLAGVNTRAFCADPGSGWLLAASEPMPDCDDADSSLPLWEPLDLDGDGAAGWEEALTCAPERPLLELGLDCDDSEAAVYPCPEAEACAVCGDGLLNACGSSVAKEATTCSSQIDRPLGERADSTPYRVSSQYAVVAIDLTGDGVMEVVVLTDELEVDADGDLQIVTNVNWYPGPLDPTDNGTTTNLADLTRDCPVQTEAEPDTGAVGSTGTALLACTPESIGTWGTDTEQLWVACDNGTVGLYDGMQIRWTIQAPGCETVNVASAPGEPIVVHQGDHVWTVDPAGAPLREAATLVLDATVPSPLSADGDLQGCSLERAGRAGHLGATIEGVAQTEAVLILDCPAETSAWAGTSAWAWSPHSTGPALRPLAQELPAGPQSRLTMGDWDGDGLMDVALGLDPLPTPEGAFPPSPCADYPFDECTVGDPPQSRNDPARGGPRSVWILWGSQTDEIPTTLVFADGEDNMEKLDRMGGYLQGARDMNLDGVDDLVIMQQLVTWDEVDVCDTTASRNDRAWILYGASDAVSELKAQSQACIAPWDNTDATEQGIVAADAARRQATQDVEIGDVDGDGVPELLIGGSLSGIPLLSVFDVNDL